MDLELLRRRVVRTFGDKPPEAALSRVRAIVGPANFPSTEEGKLAAAAMDKLTDYLVSRYGDGVRNGTTTIYSNKDLGAKIASGSQGCQGMVVVPCSMKSLAGIAHGLSRNLVERAADVMLKERRPLIIVPRETPMSLPQLKNMVLCAEAGAMIMPAMPAFYQMPKTLDDLADFMAGKILSALGFEHELYPAWNG